MAKRPPPPPAIRSSSTPGGWFVEYERFFQYSHVLLAELEAVCRDVHTKWSKRPSESIKLSEADPDLRRIVHRRDRLADSVKVFTAMSVEAFLNFYGVLRLGQDYFDEYVERLGPVTKLKFLFSTCEAVELDTADPLVVLTDRIAKRRNRLVHPRVVEVHSTQVSGIGDKIPEAARDAVADMVAFFNEFGLIDREVGHHLPLAFDHDA